MPARIKKHPILGKEERTEEVKITVDGETLRARKGEMIVAALFAGDIRINRYTVKKEEPRGLYCGIGQCTDCTMVVNDQPNVRTCVTPVEEGMVIETQRGLNKGENSND